MGKPAGWMDQPIDVDAHIPSSQWGGLDSAPSPLAAVSDDDAPPSEFVQVRRSRLRLSATLTGVAVDYLTDDEEAPALWFRRDWLARRGLRPDRLVAVDVHGSSMEPGLFDGDVVLINTLATEPKDGVVFAVNYEGQPVIKRLVRDAGQWWLCSDNPNQALYPRKVYDAHSSIVGQVVHKQSEEI